MNLTPEQLDDILRRSSEGESVARIIRTMDLGVDDTLEYLKGHHEKLKVAKETFRKAERDKKDKK